MTFSQPILKTIKTSSNQRPSEPNLVIENPIDKDIFVSGMVLLPDSYFSLKGKCIITINDVEVFGELDSEALKLTSEVSIPLNQKQLGRGNDIKIFIWNTVDTDQIEITVNAKLTDNPNEPFSGAKAIDRQILKDDVSDFENIFPLINRAVGSYPELINMKGYKTLHMMISKPVPSDLPIGTQDSGSGFVPAPLIADGLLTSFGSLSATNDVTRYFKAEFATSISRNIIMKTGFLCSSFGSGHTITGVFERSSDGIAWTPITTINETYNEQPQERAHSVSVTTTDRFFRITVTSNKTAGQATLEIKCYEIYNSAVLGGSGALSFEEKNSVGNWIESIPASEFGTFTDETQDILKQIGETTKSTSGFTYRIPSHQSRLRAKLVISGGGLTNAVDILRIS